MFKENRNWILIALLLIANLFTINFNVDKSDIDSLFNKLSGRTEAPVQDFYYYAKRGLDYFSRNQYKQAIPEFNKAIELNPNYDELYLHRGCCYRRLNKFEPAIRDFNKTAELNPRNVLAYYDLGELYSVGLRQQETAIQYYDKAIELNTYHRDSYLNRGYAYLNLGKWERAIPDLNKSIEIQPSSLAYNNLGICYHKLSRFDEAIKSFDKALELNPNYADVYNNRGNVYYDLSQFERAIQDFNKTLSLNPNHDFAKNNRAECYKALGK